MAAKERKEPESGSSSFSSSSSSPSSNPRGGIEDEDEDENEEEDEGAVHGQGVWPHKKIRTFMKVRARTLRYVPVSDEMLKDHE